MLCPLIPSSFFIFGPYSTWPVPYKHLYQSAFLFNI